MKLMYFDLLMVLISCLRIEVGYYSLCLMDIRQPINNYIISCSRQCIFHLQMGDSLATKYLYCLFY